MKSKKILKTQKKKQNTKKYIKGGSIDYCNRMNIEHPFNFINPYSEKTLSTGSVRRSVRRSVRPSVKQSQPGSLSFEEQVLTLFPFEECKKPSNASSANCLKRDSKLDLAPLTKLSQSIYNNMKSTKINLSNITEIYAFIQKENQKIFNYYTPNDKDIITTWYEFKESDKTCNYDNFRKLAVDYLIIMIIIYLFNSEKYTISKGTNLFFDSEPTNIHSESIKYSIVYQVVGSEDKTSDYDISIFSIPPHPLISKINSIFTSAFVHGLGISPNDIFDTNLYCHYFYLFTKEDPQYENNNDINLFLRLDSKRFFLNSGNSNFIDNELLFSNLNYFDSNTKYNFQEFLKSQTVFEEVQNIKKTIESCTSINCGTCTLLTCTVPTINTRNQTKTKYKFCITNNNTTNTNTRINNKKCKHKLEDYIETRSDVDSISIDFFEDIYNNGISNNTDGSIKEALRIKQMYISPMRLSLWYADETYATFSAYFHVIHCLGIPDQNIDVINNLLSIMKLSFINICKVSILDNFAFIFHYYSSPISEFIKKTAKYIARISHACALIKLLQKTKDNSSNPFLLTTSNINEFKNFGNHNDIISKYKKAVKTNILKLENGLFTTEILQKLLDTTNTLPIDIIKAIYDILIQGGYEILPQYLCIIPTKM
jgi:hypothetical protein